MIPSWMIRAVKAGFNTSEAPTTQEALAFASKPLEVKKPVKRRRRTPEKSFKQVVLDVGGLPPIFPPDLSMEPQRYDN